MQACNFIWIKKLASAHRIERRGEKIWESYFTWGPKKIRKRNLGEIRKVYVKWFLFKWWWWKHNEASLFRRTMFIINGHFNRAVFIALSPSFKYWITQVHMANFKSQSLCSHTLIFLSAKSLCFFKNSSLTLKLTHWKRPWCWERSKAGGEGDGRGWDGWMASPTRWTWVWASSGSWWWTGSPGVLRSTGSQRVGDDWAAELKVETGRHHEGQILKHWLACWGKDAQRILNAWRMPSS